MSKLERVVLPYPEGLLCSVKNPAQYLGGEPNAVYKSDGGSYLRMCLAFPDTYSIGMSHLGLQLLYSLANSLPWCAAERAFMPEADCESELRQRKLPLKSLESYTPLAGFDLLGFSLQYELCATNVLAMLELGGIPLLSSHRSEGDTIVIGGGPLAFHPEPLADFFDVFLLGDAEEALPEVLDVVYSVKRSVGHVVRSEILAELHRIQGIYVPCRYRPVYSVRGGTDVSEDGGEEDRSSLSQQLLEIVAPADKPVVEKRLLPDLAGLKNAFTPLVPLVETVHNRLGIELMRGCVRGCRFCQAGYIYRPQREVPPEELVGRIGTAVCDTGFEEMSLLSLSTADYSQIVPVLRKLRGEYEGLHLDISFPSTRVDSLSTELLDQTAQVRRNSLTLAPEGGSQRLRDLINKGLTDEQILETAAKAFAMGWRSLKLYFMIGLPTEEFSDLEAIVNLAERIKAIPEAKGKQVTVSASTFVPKPHTPFQWARQITPDETKEKQNYLWSALNRRGVKFRSHPPFASMLEGILSRGSRQLSQLILKAYRLGCHFDAWVEHINAPLWQRAFEECGVDVSHELRERDIDEVLPWGHLGCGVSEEFFKREYRRALGERGTISCLHGYCPDCGVCDDDVMNIFHRGEDYLPLVKLGAVDKGVERKLSDAVCDVARVDETLDVAGAALSERSKEVSKQDDTAMKRRFRICYSKLDRMSFAGHLETNRLILRLLRQAGVGILYTQGISPKPRVATSPPVGMGIRSEAEFFDLWTVDDLDTSVCLQKLRSHSVAGLSFRSIAEVPLNAPSLQSVIVGLIYRLDLFAPPGGLLGEYLRSSAEGADSSDLPVGLTAGLQEFLRSRDEASSIELVEYIAPVAEQGREQTNGRDGGRFGDRVEEQQQYHGSVVFYCASRLQKSLRPRMIADVLTELPLGDYQLSKTDVKFVEDPLVSAS